MTRRFLILIFILTAFANLCFSQDGGNDDRLRTIVRQQGQAQVKIPDPGRKELDIITRNVSVLSVKDDTVSISLSPRTVEWFIQQKFNYVIFERPEVRKIISAMSPFEAMEWDSYPSYDQYVATMRNFASLYPSLCRLDTIGTSNYGKLILALKISDNVTIDEDEPEVFYTSTIHGDETSGFILMLHLADYILKNYDTDARVKELADNLQIWINPLSNPDGTYRTGNTISSPVRYNANGYDLNRNFPDPFTPYNSSNVQQKETADMIRFMAKHRFVLSANFHSGAEVVNYPWDRWYSKHHPDEAWFHDISRAYADTVHKYSAPGYMNYLENGVTRGAAWYVIYGGRQDYVTYERQGREVTIELDDSYVTQPAQLPVLWEYNYRSLIEYLRNALYGIHGKVLDEKNNDPLGAKIFIPNHDADSSQVYSDTLTGSFVRFLVPGSWNLLFTSKDYRDTIVTNVTISRFQRTDVLVEMKHITVPLPPDESVIYPNPSHGDFHILLPDPMTGKVNIRIFDQAGRTIIDNDMVAEKGVPLKIEVRKFASGIYNMIIQNKLTGTSVKQRLMLIK